MFGDLEKQENIKKRENKTKKQHTQKGKTNKKQKEREQATKNKFGICLGLLGIACGFLGDSAYNLTNNS